MSGTDPNQNHNPVQGRGYRLTCVARLLPIEWSSIGWSPGEWLPKQRAARKWFSIARRPILLVVALCTLVVGGHALAVNLPTDSGAGDAPVFAILQGPPASAPMQTGQLRIMLDDQIAAAVGAGAKFVVLSRLSGDDTPPRSIQDPMVAHLSDIAREHEIWIAVPLRERVFEETPEQFYRTSLLIDDNGEIVRQYRQVIVDKRRYGTDAKRGDFRATLETIDADGYRIGLLNGRDLLAGIPRMANRGAVAVLIHADWEKNEPADWIAQARKQAERYDLHLVIANEQSPATQTGEPLGSMIMERSGVLQTRTARNQPLAYALAPRPTGPLADIPLGLPRSVPAPEYRPATPEMVELGRVLFFDTDLSSDGTVSCGTCHVPQKGFANGERVGTGIKGLTTKRNVPTMLNVAFRPLLRWDGYASTIENFVKYPISGHNEMNLHYLDALLDRFNNDPSYVRRFRHVFGARPIEFPHVEQALAAYLRTLLSGNSAFDRYWFAGEENALDADQKRGLSLFLGRARCGVCHTIRRDRALFSDFAYHNLGVGWDAGQEIYRDLGLGGISTNDFAGLFQTPSLRDVARTAPYMHDGSLRTLTDVVDFYNNGAISSPGRDPLIQPLRLSKRDRDALVAFLQSLNGDGVWLPDGRPLEPGDAIPAGDSARRTELDARKTRRPAGKL